MINDQRHDEITALTLTKIWASDTNLDSEAVWEIYQDFLGRIAKEHIAKETMLTPARIVWDDDNHARIIPDEPGQSVP